MSNEIDEKTNDYWRYIIPNEKLKTHKTDSKLNKILIECLAEYKPTNNQKELTDVDLSVIKPTFTLDELYVKIYKRARLRVGENISIEQLPSHKDLNHVIESLLGVDILTKNQKQTSNGKTIYSQSNTFTKNKTFQSIILENIKTRGSKHTTKLDEKSKTNKNIVASRFNGTNGNGNILVGVYDPKEESNIGLIKKHYLKISALNTPQVKTQIITSEEYKQNTNGYTHQHDAIYAQLTTKEMTFLLHTADITTKDIDKYKPKSGTYIQLNSKDATFY
ncbi:hypothetical protein GQ473_02330 [archaeon]|nr:hypothetical protein [archaeon]